MRPAPERSGGSTAAVEHNRLLIHGLLPNIAPQEAARDATTLTCGSRLAQCPYPTGSSVTRFTQYNDRVR
jgi:hypothetical protein